MLKKGRTLIGAGALLFLCSCTSISTLQTAKTTDKGTFDHVIGVGSVKADVSEVSGVNVDSGDANSNSVTYPMVEYMGRYGITDRIDAGLRTTGMVHGIDAKWNFYDAGTFLMSADLGLGYLGYKVSNGTSDVSVTAIDITPALIMDFVIADKARIYLAPKLVHRTVSATGSSNQTVDYLGGSVGFRFGQTAGVFLEYTMLNANYTPSGSTISNDVSLSQFAGGFFF